VSRYSFHRERKNDGQTNAGKESPAYAAFDDPVGAGSAFAVTKPSDVAWLERHLGPMPVGTYIGTFTFEHSGSNGLKRTYIASTKPAYALLASTRNRIRGDNTWSFTTLAAGHDSIVTAPDELASLIMVV
jgi:hypothetical protein